MNGLVPVQELAHLRLAMPAHDRWIDTLTWIPVSTTELHLASRYYPIAVRMEDQQPRLGLIVDRRYLGHSLLDSAGTWRGAYRPVALRCFPFEAPDVGDLPLSDILVAADSEYLSATSGSPLVDEAGRPSPLLNELHRLFQLLKRSRDAFSGALDQYLVGGLLVPLEASDASGAHSNQPLYVINGARLAQLDNAGLAAMARHNFLGIDVAITWQFSLQNLQPKYRPKNTGHYASRTSAPVAHGIDTTLIDDLSLVLDDGELISLTDLGISRPEMA